MSTPQAPRSRSRWVVVTAAVAALVTAYPAAYGAARVTGALVHRSWIGPDGHEQHEIGPSMYVQSVYWPLRRAFGPLSALEERLRHFS